MIVCIKKLNLDVCSVAFVGSKLRQPASNCIHKLAYTEQLS